MYQLHGIILFRIDCCHMVKAHVSVQWFCECSIENLVLDFLSLVQRDLRQWFMLLSLPFICNVHQC